MNNECFLGIISNYDIIKLNLKKKGFFKRLKYTQTGFGSVSN